jgi:hypothetical protein
MRVGRQARVGKSAAFISVALTILLLPMFVARPVQAAVSFVQGTALIGTSVSLTSTATAGNLLVVICGTNASSTIGGPSGYTQIINQAGTVSQAMFYKISAGNERTGIGCTFTGTGTEGVQVLEYSGIHTYTTLEGSSSSSGTSTTVNSGTVTTTHANDLLIAAGVSNAQNQITWNSPFTDRVHDEKTNGSQSGRDAVSSSDRVVSSGASYSATASAGNAAWRGQIVAFRAMDDAPNLAFDFVDGGGSSVSSPSGTLGTVSPTFTCQTVTGTLGSSTQRLRVTNTSDNPSWTLTMAATDGPTATWSAPTVPPHSYKFNDAAGSGCTNGQLTVNASAGTLTAQTNCSTSGVTKGSSTAFVSGTVNTATILNAASPAAIDCYWELINVSLSQKVPAGQLGGNYTINMTVTITAN